MRSPLRIVTLLLGVFFALQGLTWIFDPARAAAGLAMPLLDGLGRSTRRSATLRHSSSRSA